jgi:hypothetical protein
MGTFLIILCALFWIVGVTGQIMLLFEAYSDDQTQGWLCFLIAPYAIYYCIKNIDPPKKWIILGLWLGGAIPGAILWHVLEKY